MRPSSSSLVWVQDISTAQTALGLYPLGLAYPSCRRRYSRSPVKGVVLRPIRNGPLDRKIARSALLPQASLKATEEVERFNVQAFIGTSIEGLPKNLDPFQSINAGSRFSTPLFDLSLLRKYQASGHQLEASKEDEKSTREETVLLTAAQYLALLRAEASVKAAESRVQLAESLAKQAHDLLSSGVSTNIDASRAEVRVLTERQALIDAQSEIESNTFALH
jgi:outer membrane protein